MKREIKNCLLLFSLVCSARITCSQNAAEDFKKARAAYDATSALSMDVIYKSYPDYTTTVENESQAGSFKRQGDKLYSNLLGIETLQNAEQYLIVENNSKKLVVLDPVKTTSSATPVNVDSVLSICSSVKFFEAPTGNKIYKLSFDKQTSMPYAEIDFSIDKQSFLINKIVMYYRNEVNFNYQDSEAPKKKPRLEIIYKNINTHAVFAQDQFSEKKYITVTSAAIKPIGKYSAYELINQKNLNK
jgi:hypothetical protein